MSKYPKRMRVTITTAMIDEATCRDPNHCAIKLAVKQLIGGHGYVNVKNGRVSITRRPDYRERAILPQQAIDWYAYNFDNNKIGTKPISFWLTFEKTSKIVKRDQAQVNAWRNERKARGLKEKKYTVKQRLAGCAIPDGVRL